MSRAELRRSLYRQVLQTFVTGVFGILPLALTLAVLAWIVVFLHDLAGPSSTFGYLLRSVGLTVTACEVTAYVLGMLGTLLLVYCLGLAVERGLGRRWQSLVDRTLQRVPLISTVYDASKNLTSVFDRRQDSLQGMIPVMCYFGAECAAGTPALMPTSDLVRIADHDYHVVIIPTAPVPFGGALVCVKAEWVKPAGCTFDELLGIYMSMGYSAPKCLSDTVQDTT